MSEMTETDKDFYRIGTSFKRPIPGSSLTRSPEDRYTWEQPPAITDSSEASRFFFMKLVEPKVYNAVLDSVEEGTPLMDISQMLMYQAFSDGVINPDLMLTMVEQVVYMIAALAERQGIDFIIQEDDEDDIEEAAMERSINFKSVEKEEIEIPEEITQQLDEADIPERRSLLGEQ
tara:strand:+ start:4184 stop:4708 length:525 start_codon:yes stop_codon:yes gene_type:complete